MSGDNLDPLDRLARFTLAHKHGDRVTRAGAISDLDIILYAGSDDADEIVRDSQHSTGLPGADEVTRADTLAGLALIGEERHYLNLYERTFIEAYMDRGGTWPTGAEALGYPSGGALRSRYRRLGGTRTWPAGRPAGPQPRRVVWTDSPDDEVAERDWLVRARVRLIQDVRTGGVGAEREGRAGEELIMVMRGKAGALPALDVWSTDEPAASTLLASTEDVEILDVLEEISPWSDRKLIDWERMSRPAPRAGESA